MMALDPPTDVPRLRDSNSRSMMATTNRITTTAAAGGTPIAPSAGAAAGTGGRAPRGGSGDPGRSSRAGSRSRSGMMMVDTTTGAHTTTSMHNNSHHKPSSTTPPTTAIYPTTTVGGWTVVHHGTHGPAHTLEPYYPPPPSGLGGRRAASAGSARTRSPAVLPISGSGKGTSMAAPKDLRPLPMPPPAGPDGVGGPSSYAMRRTGAPAAGTASISSSNGGSSGLGYAYSGGSPPPPPPPSSSFRAQSVDRETSRRRPSVSSVVPVPSSSLALSPATGAEPSSAVSPASAASSRPLPLPPNPHSNPTSASTSRPSTASGSSSRPTTMRMKSNTLPQPQPAASGSQSSKPGSRPRTPEIGASLRSPAASYLSTTSASSSPFDGVSGVWAPVRPAADSHGRASGATQTDHFIWCTASASENERGNYPVFGQQWELEQSAASIQCFWAETDADTDRVDVLSPVAPARPSPTHSRTPSGHGAFPRPMVPPSPGRTATPIVAPPPRGHTPRASSLSGPISINIPPVPVRKGSEGSRVPFVAPGPPPPLDTIPPPPLPPKPAGLVMGRRNESLTPSSTRSVPAFSWREGSSDESESTTALTTPASAYPSPLSVVVSARRRLPMAPISPTLEGGPTTPPMHSHPLGDDSEEPMLDSALGSDGGKNHWLAALEGEVRDMEMDGMTLSPPVFATALDEEESDGDIQDLDLYDRDLGIQQQRVDRDRSPSPIRYARRASVDLDVVFSDSSEEEDEDEVPDAASVESPAHSSVDARSADARSTFSRAQSTRADPEQQSIAEKIKKNSKPGSVHGADLRISQIRVYPIKVSCVGVELSEAEYDNEGFDLDRKWMIVDVQKNKQLSARDNRGIKASLWRRLVRVLPTIERDPTSPTGGVLRVSFPDSPTTPSFAIPLYPTADDLGSWETHSDFDLWGHAGEGYIVQHAAASDATPSDTPSEILSAYIGRPVLLVMNTPAPRPLPDPLVFDAGRLEYGSVATVRYPDCTPFLLVSEASLADAQAKVHEMARGLSESEAAGAGCVAPSPNQIEAGWADADEPKPLCAVERFRPNVVVSGVVDAFGEDDWIEIAAGGGVFFLPARCPRCMFPNVDPETAERDRHMPNNAMMAYRKVDIMAPTKYCLGMYMLPVAAKGKLRVGDQLVVVKSAVNPSLMD
ncbi:unnamed protein product [Mycena citricolor]|uniref:MOSC domain-containing protein n=1 Tax=Mycena citricolor TaxID=2018698 RepID=A0AAD2HC92_9AGAR|nr:unnamed protein product [Mycena citricolor]